MSFILVSVSFVCNDVIFVNTSKVIFLEDWWKW